MALAAIPFRLTDGVLCIRTSNRKGRAILLRVFFGGIAGF
jgi:hypothetical protein